MFEKLTILDYQIIMDYIHSDMDEMDKEINVVSMLSGKTPTEIEAMLLDEYTELKKKVGWIYGSIPETKPIRFWKGYQFIYDVRKISTGRYIAIQHFLQGGIVKNLHNLAACIVKPKWGKYKAEHHEKYAADMLNAPLIAVHSSMVFFCTLFPKLVQAVVNEAANKTEMTPDQIKTVTHLKSLLAGLSMQNDLPNTSD